MAEKTSKPGEVKTAASAGVPAGYKKQAVQVEVGSADGQAFAKAVACKLTRPEVSAAAVIENWQKDTHDVNELVAELARQVETVNSGDMHRAEGMLIAQAHALESIFANLARRATNQEYLKQWEAYMRMALKAQNQCRMTLETLAAIKNPPVVIARQANINNGGQQQVNNGASHHAAGLRSPGMPTVVGGNVATPPLPSGNVATRPLPAPAAVALTHAANHRIKQTELLEANYGERLDRRTAGSTSQADPHLAAMGEVDRAAHRRGQGPHGTQRVQRRAVAEAARAGDGDEFAAARTAQGPDAA